jgi:hypothetical protein
MSEMLPFEFVKSLVELILRDWPQPDIERYFAVAYRDPEIQLQAYTTSSNAAQILAQGVADRMRSLRSNDRRRLE